MTDEITINSLTNAMAKKATSISTEVANECETKLIRMHSLAKEILREVKSKRSGKDEVKTKCYYTSTFDSN